MSTYTPKPGSFSLFKNDRREKDTHPEYKGTGVLPDGSPAEIAAWVKETRDGRKFFSISIKAKEARPAEDDFRRDDPAALAGSGADDPFYTPF